MKKSFLILLLLLSVIPTLLLAQDQNKQEVILRNEDIVMLTRASVPPKVIITKIQHSKCKFDVDLKSLVKLNDVKVNADVVSEMIIMQARNEQWEREQQMIAENRMAEKDNKKSTGKQKQNK